jgi:hypothetical protein
VELYLCAPVYVYLHKHGQFNPHLIIRHQFNSSVTFRAFATPVKHLDHIWKVLISNPGELF